MRAIMPWSVRQITFLLNRIDSSPSRNDEAMPIHIQVDCYAGHRAEEEPRAFAIGNRRVRVAVVIDRWLAPNHRYIKVRGDDSAIYILRHDVATYAWDLVVFERK